MTSKRIPTALLLLLIFSAATFVGWKMNGRPAVVDGGSSDHSLSSRTNQPTTSGEGMSLLAKQRSEEDRLRTAIELALSLPSSEIGTWLTRGKFTFREGYAITLFQQIAFERWSRDEPSAFLDWVRKNGGESFGPQLAVLFKDHPEVLTEALATHQDHEERARLLSLAIAADPDLAAAELSKILPLPNDLSHSLQKTLITLFEARPEELQALVEKFPGGSNNPLVVAGFVHKLTHQFDEGLNELFARADGYEILFPRYNRYNRFESEKFLTRLADFPESWRTKMLQDPSRICDSLKSHENAFEIDWEGFGFTPSETQKIQLSMLKTVMNKDPKAVFEHLDDYGFSAEEKADLLHAGRFRNQSLEELTELSLHLKSPDDRAHLLQEIEARKNVTELSPSDLIDDSKITGVVDFGGLYRSWESDHKVEFIEKFQTMEPDEKTRLSSLMINVPDLPLALEGDYIGQLLSHPEGHDLPGWGHDGYQRGALSATYYTLKLLAIDTEKTTAWVEALPDNPARIQVKQNLALNWRNLDPEGAQEWIASQPVDERTAITKFLEGR